MLCINERFRTYYKRISPLWKYAKYLPHYNLKGNKPPMQQFVCQTRARRQRSCTTWTGILVTVCALCPAPRWRYPQCTSQDMSTRTRERATWRLISARWLMLGEPSRNFNIGKNGFPRALLKHFFLVSKTDFILKNPLLDPEDLLKYHCYVTSSLLKSPSFKNCITWLMVHYPDIMKYSEIPK